MVQPISDEQRLAQLREYRVFCFAAMRNFDY